MVKKKLLACILVITVLSTVLLRSQAEKNDTSGENQTVSITELEQHEAAPLSDFSYRLEHGKIHITGYHGNDEILKIAETYTVNGRERRVTGIDKSAFEANEALTKVILPATLESIGDYAFYDCTSLVEVAVLSDSVTIGEQAFGYYYTSYDTDDKIEDFTLIAHEGSTAQEYLDENELSFTVLESLYTIGDIDGNGEFTSVDLIILVQHLLGESTLKGDAYKAADINNDKRIDLVDLLRLKKIIAGYEEPSNPPAVKQYTVTFVDWNGTMLKTQTVNEGESVIPPSDPTREGYTFNGWSGSYTNVTENTTVTATYIEKPTTKYTVTFYDYDGITILKTQEVTEGENATPPADPSKDGANFLGWSGSYVAVSENSDAKAVYSDEKNVLYWETEDGSVGDTITATLKIGGSVSLCRYFISLKYDPSILQLLDYDSELSIYMSTVNPEKDESGNIIGDAAGNINLTWATSSNKTKKAGIIELQFKVLNDTKPAEIQTIVNAMMALSGSEQVNVDFSATNTVINAK